MPFIRVHRKLINEYKKFEEQEVGLAITLGNFPKFPGFLPG